MIRVAKLVGLEDLVEDAVLRARVEDDVDGKGEDQDHTRRLTHLEHIVLQFLAGEFAQRTRLAFQRRVECAGDQEAEARHEQKARADLTDGGVESLSLLLSDPTEEEAQP